MAFKNFEFMKDFIPIDNQERNIIIKSVFRKDLIVNQIKSSLFYDHFLSDKCFMFRRKLKRNYSTLTLKIVKQDKLYPPRMFV